MSTVARRPVAEVVVVEDEQIERDERDIACDSTHAGSARAD